jgi:hypothetical protein
VKAVVKVMPDLVNVVLFLLFAFFIFSLIGMNFYSGQLYNRCSVPLNKEVWPRKYEIDFSNLRACSKGDLGYYNCQGENTICGEPFDFGL